MSDQASNKVKKDALGRTIFPDKAREETLRRIADKENWGTCPRCDWLYEKSKLTHCPLCRYEWRNGKVFVQPKYESPSFSS